MRLKDKKALITGGSQGIGLAIAKSFHKEGAQVSIVSRSSDKLKKAQAQLGKETLALPADITKITDLDRIYRQSNEKIGKLDVLVVNAGIFKTTPLATTTEEEFDSLIATNLKGVFFTVQRALPYLNEGASIILISSFASKMGIKDVSVYGATKAAVVSMAQYFAADLLSKKIRVNSISPGVIVTPMFESIGLSNESENDWKKFIPMNRFAKPEEVAGVALFLATQDSSYMTGTDIAVDGGSSGISPFKPD